ncbi:Arginine biosynthesis bifunctional protein ArgJ, chloroplastic [Melia azedarach]|uniref:Arginine biosynthesis bifunctional protein ArgJ, chloroplastic n=1 Tax=Melia azedarach TaxID=155640 RepID=A0ACC1X0J7_MELAZ|nr:Arginine biosynthesis bifunctional protein ArgJ, chloroplastic [Melia azedarach]
MQISSLLAIYILQWKILWLPVSSLRVDGATSTNDTVIALASGLSGSSKISFINCKEAIKLQGCLDVVGSDDQFPGPAGGSKWVRYSDTVNFLDQKGE